MCIFYSLTYQISVWSLEGLHQNEPMPSEGCYRGSKAFIFIYDIHREKCTAGKILSWLERSFIYHSESMAIGIEIEVSLHQNEGGISTGGNRKGGGGHTKNSVFSFLRNCKNRHALVIC